MKFILSPFYKKHYTKDICDKVLREKNTYYKSLNKSNQSHFIYRLMYFLGEIKIDSNHEDLITIEKKILIASAFIQLTFGLKRYRLRNFSTIKIHKDSYIYENVNVAYNGDTNPKTGVINMVWKIVRKGYEIDDDALNLAIHEFSHALLLDNKKRMSFKKFYRSKLLMNYFLASKTEMHRIREGKDSIFRKYGATNLMEFFAVSVEVFFEQTNRFAMNNPNLFEKLCLILKQDPRLKDHPRI